MIQPNGSPSLEDYTQREYVHRRLAKMIPTEYQDSVDYPIVMNAFQFGLQFAWFQQEKKPIEFNVKGHETPDIRATIIASSALYNFGYEIGEAFSRSVAADIEKGTKEYEIMSTFALKIETLIGHITTYLYPGTDITGIQKINRDSPLLRPFLPPDIIM